jgi:hypothetical protein
MIITPASQETLEKLLLGPCREAQERIVKTILTACQNTGDYSAYTHITGMEPTEDERIDVEETQPIEGPILSDGKYTVKMDIPCEDITGIPLHKYLENFALQNIIKPNLDKQELTEQYFDRIEVPSNNVDLMVVEVFNETKRKELQPTIDQCVKALFDGLDEREPDFDEGARINLTYNIDYNGQLEIESAEREYLEESPFSFTVPVKRTGTEQDIEQYLRQALPDIILKGAVLKNLALSDHPELYKLVDVDEQGQISGATARCREQFREFTEQATKLLTRQLMKMPQIREDEGGLFHVDTYIDEDGLSELQIRYVILDPEKQVEVRKRLPDVTGVYDKVDIDDIYEYKLARPLAFDLMLTNLHMAESPLLDDYEPVDVVEDQTSDGKDIKIKQFKLKDHLADNPHKREEEKAIRILYDNITDEIIAAMSALDEEESVPFYLLLDIKGDCDKDNLQEVGVAESRQVYFHPTEPGRKLELVFDMPPAAEGKLTTEEMDRISKNVVKTVTKLVTYPHLRALYHPKLNLCFVERGPEEIPLTEQGVEILKDQILKIALPIVANTVLKRYDIPEHLAGFRLHTEYAVEQDDSFSRIESEPAYFYPGDYRRTMDIPDVSKNLEAIPAEERDSRLMENYRKWSRTTAIQMLGDNMFSTRHPAFNSYFAMDEQKQPMLTETGEKALGERVDKLAERIAEQLASAPDREKGGKYVVQYSLERAGVTDIDDVQVIKTKAVGLDSQKKGQIYNAMKH